MTPPTDPTYVRTEDSDRTVLVGVPPRQVRSSDPDTVVSGPATPESTVVAPGMQGPPGPAGADGPPGPPGPPGASGDNAVAYVHYQAIASEEWTIPHNLGYRPAGAMIQDTAGTWIKPAMTHDDENNSRLHIIGATAGTAYLS